MAVTWHDGMKFWTMYNIIISAFTMIQKKCSSIVMKKISDKNYWSGNTNHKKFLVIFAGIALKLENIESQSMSIDAVGITTLMTGNSFNA